MQQHTSSSAGALFLLLTTWSLVLQRPLVVAQQAGKQQQQQQVKQDGEHVLALLEQTEEAGRQLATLPPDEARRAVADSLKRVDANADGALSEDELFAWLRRSYGKIAKAEATKKVHKEFATFDTNSDGFVTWDEYLIQFYGMNEAQMNAFSELSESAIDALNKHMALERANFEHADSNGDRQLDEPEFTAFQHPDRFEHMLEFQVHKNLALSDRNRDGIISEKEFLENRNSLGQQLENDQLLFRTYDANADGELDAREQKLMALPAHVREAAAEAARLMRLADADGDKRLSFDEIVSKYNEFVGNPALHLERTVHRADEL